MKKKILKSSKGSIAILLLFLLAVNYLVSQKTWFLDLTQDQIYTASDTSRDILGNLKNPVTATFYVSKDLPSDYVVFKTQVQDTLSQYQDISKGKLQVKYEEPGNDDAKVQELAQKGIPQLQSQVVEKDKVEVKNFFFGAEISSGDGDNAKKEVLPSLSSLEDFEYQLVSSVYSVSKDQKEIVAFLNGHGEKEIDSAEMKKSYEVDKVLISTEEGKKGFYVDNSSSDSEKSSSSAAQVSTATSEKKFIEPKTVVIAGPQSKLSAEEIAVLDDFVAKGGKVVVLSEKINIDISQGFATKNIDTNIGDFAKKYGIEINNDLVYDMSNSPVSYSKQTYFGAMQVTKEYPYWVKAVKENFGDHPSLSKIQSLILLWDSSLKAESNDGYDVKNLITSSNNSETISENINISPDTAPSFASGGKKILAAISSAKNGQGQVVVIGDSDFVSPSFMQPIADNETFFLNLIDSISSSANLSSIRSKNISERPLRETSESEKNYWKLFAVAGGAVFSGIYGFVRISRRKKASRE